MSVQSTSEYVLELKNITKRFPGVLALDNVQLQLRAGEVHVLLGENGAGKSTLIKVITGAYLLDEGQVYLDGEPVTIKSPLDSQAMGIGVVYQEFNLMPHLTVAENIFMGKEPMKMKKMGLLDKSTMEKESKKYLEMVGASLDPNTKVGTCGVAVQQLVEIAKALAANARILILDEPTAVLTNEEITKLFEVVQRLKKQNVAVIYISHRLEEIREIGDRITVLRDGTYVETVDVDQASFDKDYLIRLMVGRSIDNQFPKAQVSIGSELLRVEHLHSKGKVEDVSFTLHAGEILGVAGLVGAGRTETAKIIFGADSDATGDIYVEGKKVSIKSPLDAIRNKIGFAPEDRKTEGLMQGMSITDNVIATCFQKVRKAGVRSTSMCNRLVQGLVKDLRIVTPEITQQVRKLSGGNQQKVVLAKWIASDSKIVILDEPTRGIDVGAKVEVYQLMSELVEKGYGIIMISSELPELLAMSDRILVMYEHKLQGELQRREATQEKILKLASGGVL
ncbi:monosaccharide ABC transporter ATP-binding protein (CUT2 family) [Hydrogenoanaerobacterium saccharovorans]|uniref:Monosaccharide ABC transporter ATP-binding protein, CUT2 family n=1 Tax=Hydrogenoanaerobacterium saccharovorans TaxID=474960 RepID=A0A1H7ZAR2_9FIRM|nr:sugar ABC transporter ATP-binding protein [Hydrogenoanaerobacterium saccharovorans]RPF48771.1 monosaccharide ABC transporter ATP-binding protein (CUT2 family) [Hydrogenoanaerobacterium saccharovorans]SEM54569.1 monosaccharide ABC transporter ATP-binding protein, CUT2 family [Hydrogenoanaerobacterium saccharovorans]